MGVWKEDSYRSAKRSSSKFSGSVILTDSWNTEGAVGEGKGEGLGSSACKRNRGLSAGSLKRHFSLRIVHDG